MANYIAGVMTGILFTIAMLSLLICWAEEMNRKEERDERG